MPARVFAKVKGGVVRPFVPLAVSLLRITSPVCRPVMWLRAAASQRGNDGGSAPATVGLVRVNVTEIEFHASCNSVM